MDKREPEPGQTGDSPSDSAVAAGPEREPSPVSPWRNLLVSAGVALAAGMIGAGIILYFFGPAKSESNASRSNPQAGDPKKAGSENGSGADEPAKSGSAIPGFTRADDADALRTEIERLSERIDELGHRMDTLSQTRAAVPPDLRTLQIKVGDLTRTIEEVGNLPSRFRRLESRFEDLQQELKILRDRTKASENDVTLGGLERKTDQVLGARPDAAISPLPTVRDQPDAAWDQGVVLFKKGRYADAGNVFQQLQLTRPDDARVWYYSALAVGMTTGAWTGTAHDLVEHGLACERAGKPRKDQIDAALAGLTDSQGWKWLNAYRDRVRHP